MAKVFCISTKGIAQIMEHNGLDVTIKELHAIVKKGDDEIFNETIKQSDLKINEEGEPYKKFPADMINMAVFKYLFHRLTLAGYISVKFPANVDVYEIEMKDALPIAITPYAEMNLWLDNLDAAIKSKNKTDIIRHYDFNQAQDHWNWSRTTEAMQARYDDLTDKANHLIYS